MDENEKLYPESTLSIIQAITLLFSWFSAFPGMSKESFSQLLLLLHTFFLPCGNKLPSTYSKAHKLLEPYLSPVTEYHCCINDCIVYRNSSAGQFANHHFCPVCDESRFQSDGVTPQKRFKYISVSSRLRRMYSNGKTSELMQQHLNPFCESQSILPNLHSSTAWKEWFDAKGMFKGDSRSVSFALCTDGLNPFTHEKTQYSMWPIFIIPLNLPLSLRIKPGAMYLTGIIPGPNEPKNMDPYLDIVVDDIMDLKEMTIYDGYRNETFTLNGNICLHILDYPGQNKVFNSHGKHTGSKCFLTLNVYYCRCWSLFRLHVLQCIRDIFQKFNKNGIPKSSFIFTTR